MPKRREETITHEASILEVLRGGENYGLGIIEELSKRTNGEILLAVANIYSMLKKLEKRSKIVRSRFEEQQNAPRRIYYELTPEGLRIANENRERIAQIFGLREPDK